MLENVTGKGLMVSLDTPAFGCSSLEQKHKKLVLPGYSLCPFHLGVMGEYVLVEDVVVENQFYHRRCQFCTDKHISRTKDLR
jgi:hypothetical protein